MLLHAEFLQLEEVPDANGLIQTASGNQTVFRVEGGTHDVVGVTSQDG